MTLYRGLLTLALLATAAWAQDDRAYELKYRPEPGRAAHYQLIVHGNGYINKLPTSDKEFNGRMHLLEEILPSEDGAEGAVQRLTFMDAKFRFGAWSLTFNLQGEHLTVRRGEDALASELIHRPPTASVESGDIIGVIASLPWSVAFPRSGEARIGQTWTRRFDPAPPDVGQPIGPDTIFPRRLYTTNTLVDVVERDGRELAIIDTEMVIVAVEGTQYDVTIRGPATYWLDTGELHTFRGDLDIYVGIDFSGNLVEIIIKHAVLHFEERDPSEITVALPPNGPWEMKLPSQPEELTVWSYPVEAGWLRDAAGLTPPPNGKSYALNRKRLYERALRQLPDPRTEEQEDEALWSVVDYVNGRLFYVYRIEGETADLAQWASQQEGVSMEPLEGAPGGQRLLIHGHPELYAGYFYSRPVNRPLLVVTDDPELWDRAMQAASPAPGAEAPEVPVAEPPVEPGPTAAESPRDRIRDNREGR